MTAGRSQQTAVPLRRAALGGFLLFNVVAIVVWAVPLPGAAIARFRAGLTGYMIASGLHQNWEMFAPEPISINAFVEAEITRQDGRTSVWRFPSTEGTSYTKRYLIERYRKWANDHVRTDEDAAIWPDAARFAARVNDDAHDRPVHVRLVRHWSPVPPPDAGATATWFTYPYFEYDVQPRDLR